MGRQEPPLLIRINTPRQIATHPHTVTDTFLLQKPSHNPNDRYLSKQDIFKYSLGESVYTGMMCRKKKAFYLSLFFKSGKHEDGLF